MKTRHKEILLGTLASIIMLVIGYFVWRHENNVSQAEAQNNNQVAAQQEADLENELASLQQADSSYSSGGYFGGGSYDDHNSTSNSSDELATILEAFYGNNAGTHNSPSTGTQSGSTSTGTQSGSTSTGTQSGSTSNPVTVAPKFPRPIGGPILTKNPYKVVQNANTN